MPPKGAKILCDQGVSYEFITALRAITTFEYSYAFHEGWSEIPDGELLTVAEQGGFAVLLTTDQNMIHQQNMRGRKIGVVVLGATATDVVLAHKQQIVRAIQSITRPDKIVPVRMTTPRRSH